ncbi:MAG TPA: hypothetical protein VGF41_07015 [Myxococcaceae bacterium]
MDMPAAIFSRLSEPRTGGVALSSALLAVPALIAGHPRAGALLLAVSAFTAVVLLERRAHAVPHAREASRLSLVSSSPVRERRPARVGPQARWEVVERDGQRSLSMRWS